MASDKKFNGIEELSKITAATTKDEIASFYDNWAKDYDNDIVTLKYVRHQKYADFFDQEMKKVYQEDRFNKKVLDVGAGTGITGQCLAELGYKNVDGLDISQEMLNIARGRNVYQKYICAGLSVDKIGEIETDHYDAIVSTGAIHIGHIKPDAFHEMVRHVKPGGIIYFVIEESLVQESSHGYKDKLDELVATKVWEHLRTEVLEYCVVPATGVLENCHISTYKVLKNN